MSIKSLKSWVENNVPDDLLRSRTGSRSTISVNNEIVEYNYKDEKNRYYSFVLDKAILIKIDLKPNEPEELVELVRTISETEKSETYEKRVYVGNKEISVFSKKATKPSSCYWQTSFDQSVINSDMESDLDNIYGAVALQNNLENMLNKSIHHEIEICYINEIFFKEAAWPVKVTAFAIRIK